MHHPTDDATWIEADRDPIIAASSLAHRDVSTGDAGEGRRAESPVDSLFESSLFQMNYFDFS